MATTSGLPSPSRSPIAALAQSPGDFSELDRCAADAGILGLEGSSANLQDAGSQAACCVQVAGIRRHIRQVIEAAARQHEINTVEAVMRHNAELQAESETVGAD